MIFYFMLGILFISCLLPVLESLTSCLCTRLEEYKAKRAVYINKYNNNIIEANESTDICNPIGFQITETTSDDGE